MIIAQRKELLRIPEGTEVLMDAEIGTIYVAPSEAVRRQFHQRNQVRLQAEGRSEQMQSQTRTRDGVRVELLANINLLSELDLARELKAEGVGLYRSEFPFIVRSVFPSEEEQRLVYTQLFKQMSGKPVYIRTLDVGGDKVLPYLDIPQEANPELGLRSIRFSLRYRDVFDQQIRAILRAGVHAHQLGIMFPMISSIDEFDAARQAVQDALSALAAENLDHYAEPLIGAMIELPAIGQFIDELALKADFFSIGTNDFIQYMLAVDRTNQNVAEYYQPYHPAVLRALKNIVRGATICGKPISVCGEVAHQPEFIPFLIGIGVRRLSVDPQFLPLVQQAVTSLSVTEAEDYAGSLTAAATLSGVNEVRAAWQGRLDG
jgi:phosphotransferase system enzyme I (PtsP)